MFETFLDKYFLPVLAGATLTVFSVWKLRGRKMVASLVGIVVLACAASYFISSHHSSPVSPTSTEAKVSSEPATPASAKTTESKPNAPAAKSESPKVPPSPEPSTAVSRTTGPATNNGNGGVANTGTIGTLNLALASPGKPPIKVDEIVLDRDLNGKDPQSLVVYRNHFLRIHFSTDIDWTSHKLSVFVAGGNYPFSFVQPRELKARLDQRSPKEAVVDIFRVNTNFLHSEHGKDLTAFGELSFLLPPDQRYRSFPLEDGKELILKIGIAVNDEQLKTQEIKIQAVRIGLDPNSNQDMWDVLFEKVKD